MQSIFSRLHRDHIGGGVYGGVELGSKYILLFLGDRYTEPSGRVGGDFVLLLQKRLSRGSP